MIEMKNISKSFGNNKVLDDVNLTLQRGEILALLGENGAGKSTLMNILGGVIPVDNGELSLDGTNMIFRNPADSLQAGIAFIHQELNLVNDLPVYENMFLGNEIKKTRFTFDSKTMRKKTKEIFDKLDIKLDPDAMVSSLDASYKQIVEITRAFMMNANFIIMDEPTTSLTGPEIERVFIMMKRLRKEGVGIIFISHKLDEVMEICDCFTVLRNGKMVASDKVSNTDVKKIAKHMVGHEVRTEVLIRDIKHGDPIIRVEGLGNGTHYRDINFEVKKGEILGVTGLLGDGRSELFQTIFGDLPHYTGKIFMEGKEIKITRIADSMHHNIAYVPRNRKENGIIKDMDILENGTLVGYQHYTNKFGLIDSKKQRKDFVIHKEMLNIKMGKDTDLITSLSGGNQQKIVLMKWLINNPQVLILDNPTQGVDVGSKEEIYDIIHELANREVAIILLSNEANEIIRTCDRTLVMYHGAIQGELSGKAMNEHDIMTLATGGIQLEESNNVR